jgi:hypothetical protein
MPVLEPSTVKIVPEIGGKALYCNGVSLALKKVVSEELGVCDIFFKNELACQIYPNGKKAINGRIEQNSTIIRIRFVDKNFLGMQLPFSYEIID